MVLDQITPLILTYNEAPNLERTIRQLLWARDIVVVDSFSDDDTAVIAQSFPQTRLFERRFDTHQNQWTFGLTQTDIKTPWVLALDADYVLTDALIDELKSLEPDPSINGYRVQFIYCMSGKPLRSGIYPPVNVLYRASEAIYEQDGHTHRIKINGRVSQLHSTILHDDRKSLRRWFQSQVTYAELEARKLLTSNNKLSLADRIRTWRIFAPIGVVLYCLVWRGGLLDGWRGLFYAFQRAIAELMLSLYLIAATLSRNYKAQLLTEATTPETLPLRIK